MQFIKKIIAIIILITLLVSSMGYTLEHHFCTHCKESIEEAYLLFPDKPGVDHHCSCEIHGKHEQKHCCNESCTFNEPGHVEHFSAEITSIVPQDNQDDMGKYLVFNLLNIPETSISPKTSGYSNTTYHKIFRPPDKPDLHITNCCFLL